MVSIEPEKYVEKLARGDAEAFTFLVGKYSRKVYNVARSMNLTHEDAEGITQDAFLKIWENRARLDPQKSFNAYLLTIAKSLIIKIFRRNALNSRYREHYSTTETSSNNLTEDDIIYQDLSAISLKYVDDLPAKQKEIFELKSDNLTVAQIAEKLNISVRTVENQIYRATKTLRERVAGL